MVSHFLYCSLCSFTLIFPARVTRLISPVDSLPPTLSLDDDDQNVETHQNSVRIARMEKTDVISVIVIIHLCFFKLHVFKYVARIWLKGWFINLKKKRHKQLQ